LGTSPSEILNYHCTLTNDYEAYMDSFGINSIKSCGVYLDIETISNKKYLNYKVIDLVEYYNFNLKFIFIEHHMRKLQSFFATY
jgi:type IV secretory pathway VirB6-like protein